MRFSENEASGLRSDAEAWFAVYTKHQHEKKTAQLLGNKGIEVFLPLYHTVHQWKDRTKALTLPLFPGYLFLRSALNDKGDILSTPGVFFLVESAGRACPIVDTEIEAIRRITQSQALAEPHAFLRNGDTVRIKSGAFAGITGILTRVKSQWRIVVSVNLLQRSLSVEIDGSDVEIVKATQGALREIELLKTA